MRTRYVAALMAAFAITPWAVGQTAGGAGGSQAGSQAGGTSGQAGDSQPGGSAQPNTTPVTPQTADDPNPTTDDVAPPFDEGTPTAPRNDVNNPAANQSTADDAADQSPNTDSQRDAFPDDNAQRRTFRQPGAAAADGGARFDPGFEVSTLDGQGLSIGSVSSGSLAAEAGLQANDRIISIDGRTFTTVDEFQQFAPQLAGRRVPVVIERGGQQQTLSIDYPATRVASSADGRGWLGVYLSPEFTGSGARISRLVPGSPAARAGLRPGDIVTGINGQDIWGYRELVNTVAELDPNTRVELDVMRNGRSLPIMATVASIQRAGYRGPTESGDYYGEPPAPPQWSSDSGSMSGDRIERLERMMFQLQEEVRALRSEVSRQAR